MARALTAGMEQQVTADALRPFIAIELDFDDFTSRAWTGYGQIEIDGETYFGFGTLISVGGVQETAENKATGISLQVSGVPQENVSAALRADYQGNPCRLYLGALNINDNSVINDPYLIFRGRVDTVSLDFSGEQAAIQLTIESRLIDFERAANRRYTPNDQNLDFPDDRGFEFVSQIQEQAITWGVGVE